jgi:Holliday junction resolvase-like predicted endonuclease
MIDPEKVRRVQTGATAWLAEHPECAELDLVFEAAGVTGRRVARVPLG